MSLKKEKTNDTNHPEEQEEKQTRQSEEEPFLLRAGREFNATKHGLCAKTLILPNESQEEFDQLHARWRNEYDNPAADTVLSDFILKTAQAEWERLRGQREYDLFLSFRHPEAMSVWTTDEHKRHELLLRYKTAMERKFQRDYRMLESHHKSQIAKLERAQNRAAAAAAQASTKAEATAEESEIDSMLNKHGDLVWVQNTETGEKVSMCGKFHEPPPPDWQPMPLVPGEYGPFDPANIRETYRKILRDQKAAREQVAKPKSRRRR